MEYGTYYDDLATFYREIKIKVLRRLEWVAASNFTHAQSVD